MTLSPQRLEKAAEAVAKELRIPFKGNRSAVLEYAHAAISAYLGDTQEHGWQPIESAPKDGTNILLRSDEQYGTKVPTLCSWWSAERCAADDGGEPEDYQEGWYRVEDPGDIFCRPTHWQMLSAELTERDAG